MSSASRSSASLRHHQHRLLSLSTAVVRLWVNILLLGVHRLALRLFVECFRFVLLAILRLRLSLRHDDLNSLPRCSVGEFAFTAAVFIPTPVCSALFLRCFWLQIVLVH